MSYPKWLKIAIDKRPSIVLSLHRIIKALEKIRNPHLSIKNIIHIAGTNGKGSTLSFLKQILHKSGYSVNTYTSPHLVEFNERITLNYNAISCKQLDEISMFCEEHIPNANLTAFESTTIMALIAFAKFPADFCLIETGMGGRLDATNVFPKVILSIITSISFDHCDFLGDTIKKIAYEKSGIIRDDTPVVISKQDKEALNVLLNYAGCKNAHTYAFDIDWISKLVAEKMIFNIKGNIVEEFSLPLLKGEHQIINAGNAIMASKILQKIYGYDKIVYNSINDGIKTTYWMGRLEKIELHNIKSLLPNGYELFFDGAHNEAGATIVSDWVEDDRIYFIVGFTRGKDIKKFLSIIHKKSIYIFAVCVQSEFNAHLTHEIVEIANSINIYNIEEANSIETALLRIKEMDKKIDKTVLEGMKDMSVKKILICGSLFLYADVKKINVF